MKLRHVRHLLCATIFAVAAVNHVVFAAEESKTKTLVIAADIWCPVNCNPTDVKQGIGIDLAKKIFEPLGYKINYVVMSWSRSLEEVRAGRVDAVVGANRLDDATLVFPHNSVAPISDDFFTRRESKLQYKDLSSLNGRSIGVIKDYGYSDEVKKFLEEAGRKPGMVQAVAGDDALELNIRKLLAGRIEVVVENKLVMDHTLAQMGLSDKVSHIGSVPVGSVYMAFSPALAESKVRAQQFDEGYARLKSTGDLDSIYGAYSLKP